MSLGSEQEIFENTVNEIARAFSLDAVAVYVRTEFDHDYQAAGVPGLAPVPAGTPRSSPS